MKTIELVRLLLLKPKDEVELAMFILNGEAPKVSKPIPINRKAASKEERIVSIFAKDGMSLAGKKRGRKPDPNSKAGKVRGYVLDILSNSSDPVKMDLHWAMMSRETGMSIQECKLIGLKLPDIIRKSGEWRLAPSTKSKAA